MKPSLSARPALLLLAGAMLFTTGLLRAAEGGFTATLATEHRAAAGLTSLSDDARQALDQLVADDLAFVRREGLTELDGTFVSRRAEAERKSAGLDRLTPEQLTKLNELVAAALAARPQPKERPRLKDSDVLGAKRRGEVHGSVTVGYGWGGGGRNSRMASLQLNYQDPEGRYGIGVGITTFDGDGFWGYYPGYYSRGFYPDTFGYYDAGYYAAPRVYLGVTERDDYRGGFGPDESTYLHGNRNGGFGGRGGGRRR